MRRLLHSFKNSLHTIGAIVAILVIGTYVSSHFNLSGYIAKQSINEDLSNYLGTEVSIDNAEIDIFNQVILENVLIKDLQYDTLLYARRAMVSFDVLPLLKKKLQIHTIQFIDFKINLYYSNTTSNSNFQFLIDILAPKDKNNRRQILDDINLNSIILRSGTIVYNDYSKKRRKEFFDPNHIYFNNVSANLKITSSKSEGLFLRLKRFSLEEKSGLSVSKASAIVQVNPDATILDINDINLACSQVINQKYKADGILKGFASMQDKIFNATISTFQINCPNNIDIESSLILNDILSTKDDLSFDFKTDKCLISSQISSYFLNKYLAEQKSTIDPYLNDIDEISFEGKANGHLKKFDYDAQLATFGKLSSDISVKGIYDQKDPINLDIIASVQNLEINKYNYADISVNGNLDGERFDGSASIDDPNCEVDFKGKYYYKNGSSRVDATGKIWNIEPFALNLAQIKNIEQVSISGELDADIDLRNISQPLGKLKIDSLNFKKKDQHYFIPTIEANGTKDDDQYVAVVSSPILNGSYSTDNAFENFQGEFFNSEALSEFFQIPLLIKDNAFVKLQRDSQKSISRLEIVAPVLQYNDNTFEINLNSQKESEVLKHNLKLNYAFDKNNISTDLIATSTFTPLSINIRPCEIKFNNDLIKCGGINLYEESKGNYNLTQLSLKQGEQKVDAKGIFSTVGNMNMDLSVKNLELDKIFAFIENEFIKFGGVATGDIAFRKDSITHAGSKNLFIKDFSYLNGKLGDTDIEADFNLDTKDLNVKADVLCEDGHTSIIEGLVNCGDNDSLDLILDTNKLRIDFINTWIGGFIHNFQGNITGLMHLYGPGERLKLVGEAFAEATFTNNLSGSMFTLKDYVSAYKEPDSDDSHIDITNANLFDKFGNKAIVNAKIDHCHFNNFKYDANLRFNDPSGFLLFDKPTHYNNEMYWGQIFGIGNASFDGRHGGNIIKIDCQTTGKSQLNLSPEEESYSEKGYSFLTFRDKKRYEESEMRDYSNDTFGFYSNKNEDSSMSVDFDLNARLNENCQVYVQMDPLGDDRLLCRGTGEILLHFDPTTNFTMSGEYNMTSGGYLVTMKGDLLNKEFKIQDGSRIVIPGSFSNAELTLNATYSIPSVNLKDLDDSFATLTSLNRTTFPVDCKLLVSGQIAAPQVSFDLEVKNTSDDVQALVHNLIGTPEMLNREVFYLLLFSKFYTPEYASTSQSNSGSELSSFASSSLTSQLNNILGHISDNFTMGTNFRSDRGDFSDLEMDVSLSTRLFNDRLILNGNLGYRDPANRVGLRNNANSFIGDFDVEYLINRKGSFRAKAYSHYNERDYSINNALTTQGIGFIVRKDFKTIKELMFWKKYKK